MEGRLFFDVPCAIEPDKHAMDSHQNEALPTFVFPEFSFAIVSFEKPKSQNLLRMWTELRLAWTWLAIAQRRPPLLGPLKRTRGNCYCLEIRL